MADPSNGALLQLVTFTVGGKQFGADILQVQEIIRTVAVPKLPMSPEFVEGVLNLRDRLVPIVDLRYCFGLQHKEPDSHTRILVAENAGEVMGFVVDAVSEVLRIPPSAVEPPPSNMLGAGADFVSGIARMDSGMLVLLDLNKLLTSRDFGSFRSLGEMEPQEDGKASSKRQPAGEKKKRTKKAPAVKTEDAPGQAATPTPAGRKAQEAPVRTDPAPATQDADAQDRNTAPPAASVRKAQDAPAGETRKTRKKKDVVASDNKNPPA